VLDGADGWTVLGLPRGSAPEVVTHAVARMAARYPPLTLSAHQELRTLGKEMFARVQQAQSEIQRDGSASNPTEAQLLAAGRSMAERGNWDAADRRFSAARDESPSSALALAWLGWARFHNDTYDDALRQDEGVAFVELALAFDPRCVDALYFRAALAHAQKDTLTAWDMLDRLFRVQPAHQPARDLARQLGTRPPSS
jgi:tetratricopeptide (TPR) repeat protein